MRKLNNNKAMEMGIRRKIFIRRFDPAFMMLMFVRDDECVCV